MVGANIDVTDDMELFLEVDDSGCAYYLIDHASRTHFWVHHVDTEDLGIIPVVSSSHLSEYSVREALMVFNLDL